MVAKKYDWPALKAEYLRSKEGQVTAFLRNKFGTSFETNSGNVRAKTSGWYADKQAILAQAAEIAKDRARQELAKAYQPSMKELGEMHQATITLAKATLNKLLADCVDPVTKQVVRLPDMKTVRLIWEMTKSEKREPTEVTEVTENLLTPEESDAVSNVLAQLGITRR